MIQKAVDCLQLIKIIDLLNIGLKTRLDTYCTKRCENLVTSCKINKRLVCPIMHSYANYPNSNFCIYQS